jgi:NADH-quinone oxidoreductase subunit L
MNEATELLPFALRHAWLVPGIPLITFFLVGLFIRPRSAKLSGLVGTFAAGLGVVFACLLAWAYFHLPGGHGEGYPTLVPWSANWLQYMEHLRVQVGVLVDPLSVLLMLVVTSVSFLVHLYSIGYMHGEHGYGRYYSYLSLFTFSMLGLVVAPNIIQTFMCWELVGASSFLLIGFYYERPAAVAAAKKAFIVTRFADLGFFIGILLLGYYGWQVFQGMGPATNGADQPLDFLYLTQPEVIAYFPHVSAGIFGISFLTVAMILLFMGASGKSAMFPLHIWLPDAMEGPTPVSALIHAATMVVAGVYLVARMFPVFAAAGPALSVVAFVGAFTMLFAAVIGCTQDDIKRVLAFSTLSQIGYMMFSLGVASPEHPLGYTASLFHLFTHAFFKALLFLGAGAVIHAVHSNDIWKMGGLAKRLPVTHAVFLVATLAIAGVWPFAGFFSKDEILTAALTSGHHVIFGAGLVGAALTAFYMFRIYFVTFWGAARSEGAGHAHESPWVMLVPMIILAVASTGAGFVPFGEFLHFGEHAGHEGMDLRVAIPATTVALAGICLAWILYTGSNSRLQAAVRGLGPLYGVIKNKFYLDEVYLFVTRSIIFRWVARPVARFDRKVVDGSINLSGRVTESSGHMLDRHQSGTVQTYGTWVVAGLVFVLLVWLATLI